MADAAGQPSDPVEKVDPDRERPLLVGREREQRLLRQQLERMLAAQGSLVLVSGEAGIGKTTLVQDLSIEADEQGALVLWGHAYDLSVTPPYGPWIEIARRYQASGQQPPFPPFLDDPEALASLGSQGRLFADVTSFFQAVAAQRPLVLILDDLHWADQASLDLLRYLAREIHAHRLLLLATYRSDEVTRHHPLAQLLPLVVREAEAERLEVRPLDPGGQRALIQSRYRLPEADQTRLERYLAEHAEGNPLFAGELLRTLEDQRVLVQADDVWQLAALERARVPPLLRQVIAVRLARLTEEVRAPLEVAAVIGQEVSLELWQQVSGASDEALVLAIEQGQAAGLLEEVGQWERCRFRHALLREALYDEVMALRRRVWHRKVAEAMEGASRPNPDIVAYHYQQAGDERAQDWLIRAGEQAQRAYAWPTAAARYEAALALLETHGADAATLGWLLLRLALLRRHADRTRAVELLEGALEQAAYAADPLLAAYAQFNAGLLRCYAGEFGEGVATMAAAVASLDALPPLDAATRARLRAWGLADDPDHHRGTLANWFGEVGRYAEAQALGERVVSREAAAPAPGWLDGAFAPDAWRGLAMAEAALGRPAAALATLEHNLAAYRAAGDHLQVGITASMLVQVLLAYQGDDPAARRRQGTLAEQAFARAAAAGNPFPGAAWLAPLLVVEGRWDALRALDAPPPATHAMLGLSPLAAARADRDLARVLLAALPNGAATPPGGMGYLGGLALLRLAAGLAADVGEFTVARTWLAAHDRWLDWSGAVLGLAEGALLWARYHHAAGDRGLARQHAQQALAHAAGPRQPLALIAVHRFLGQLDIEAGQLDVAEEHLQESLKLADACAAPFERALTLLGLAKLNAAQDKRDVARALLTEVRVLCEPLEAKPTLERVAALEAKLIATPKPRYPAGLSAREVEVLQLVAQGLTDAEVAARLYLSPRTVSSHLRSIYNKIGAGSRAAASRFAAEHGLV